MKNLLFLSLSIISLFVVSCSSSINECEEIDWYEDLNQNGLGNPEVSIRSCNQPEGYVSNAEDLNDPCFEQPYLQPYWALCSSTDLCAMETYPVILMLDNEPQLPNNDYQFQWFNHTTGTQTNLNSNHFLLINKNDSISLEITFPDGCTYVLSFSDDCN